WAGANLGDQSPTPNAQRPTPDARRPRRLTPDAPSAVHHQIERAVLPIRRAGPVGAAALPRGDADHGRALALHRDRTGVGDRRLVRGVDAARDVAPEGHVVGAVADTARSGRAAGAGQRAI